MQTATSKLTKKYQATIPEPVRTALQLQAGDAVAFDIQGKSIQLRKAQAIDLSYAQSLEGTLTEWATAEDEKAYRDL